jgi:hypothetical protein
MHRAFDVVKNTRLLTSFMIKFMFYAIIVLVLDIVIFFF